MKRTQTLTRVIAMAIAIICVPAMADQKDDEIARLQEKVKTLTQENQQLRLLIARPSPSQRATANTQENTTDSSLTTNIEKDNQTQPCWLTTSSSKRHNANCRYFKTSRGRPCKNNEGIPCKICGG